MGRLDRGRHADRDGVVRDVGQYDRVRPDAHAVADRDAAEDARAGADVQSSPMNGKSFPLRILMVTALTTVTSAVPRKA